MDRDDLIGGSFVFLECLGGRLYELFEAEQDGATPDPVNFSFMPPIKNIPHLAVIIRFQLTIPERIKFM
jgi:hypothetical protein